MPYTLEDLEKAEREVKGISEGIADHRANNIDYGQAALRAARRVASIIRDELKRTGVISLTEKEKLKAMLDKQFPKAKSREIVDFEGKRYQRRFRPEEVSRSGKTVKSWLRWWEEVKS